MRYSACHPDKPLKARGMCSACYVREYNVTHPEYVAKARQDAKTWRQVHAEEIKVKDRLRQEKRKLDPGYKQARRSKFLWKTYQITQHDFDELLAVQGGGCALCGAYTDPNKFNLHVDHCHVTGRIRGILCHQCNWYLGKVDADPDLLRRIAHYRETANPFNGPLRAGLPAR